MYLQHVWGSSIATGTEPWNSAVAGKHLVSVLALFVSNCKWHCAVQTQLVIAAHDKYTLWRVQVISEICYTEQYIGNMVRV